MGAAESSLTAVAVALETQVMKALQHHVSARSGKGSLIVYVNSPHADQRLDFVGASLRASVRSGEFGLNSFTLVRSGPREGADPQNEKADNSEDIVAFATQLFTCNGTPIIQLGGIYPITSKGDELHVDLDRPFVPHADRLGQFRFEGKFATLCVEIGGELYSAQRPKDVPGGVKVHAVLEANLLCRYLVGKATAEEVKAAVNPLFTEANAVTCPRESKIYQTMIEDGVTIYPMMGVDEKLHESTGAKFKAGPIWQDCQTFHRFFLRRDGELREAVWSDAHNAWMDYPD